MHRVCLIAAALAAPVLVPATPAPARAAQGPETDRYPEGVCVPRSLTPAEAALVKEHPIVAADLRVAPPGLVRTPAEYDPCEAILLAWEGNSSWLTILAQMAAEITTTGDADVDIFVDSTSERTSAAATVAARGADMDRVHFIVHTTDTIWMRDYGPRAIYLGVQPDGAGGVRAVVDHTYNRPRPNDNAVPAFWAMMRGEPSFLIPLVHGGGNFHLASAPDGAATGTGNATELILNENPGRTEAEIIDLWRRYENLETTIYTPYPTSIDSTQHIDMWMIMLDDHTVMISDWVNEPDTAWAISSDQAADDLAARGFAVVRVPACRSGGTHYTFTNAVICNQLVLIPSYTNATAAAFNATALATWQAACPDKTIVAVPSQSIVTYAGVLHCIAMHVPRPSGGEAPSIYITTLNDGEALEPGSPVAVEWLSDDDVGATTVDVLLSTDGGASYPETVAAGLSASSGSYDWMVPDRAAADARLKLVVHDADGHTGFDVTDATFAIHGSACPADFNADGAVNFFDLTSFLDAFSAEDPAADVTGEGVFDFFDIAAFLETFAAGCP